MRKLPFAWFHRALSGLFFPTICRYCGSTFQQGHSNILCRSCLDSVQPYQEPVCAHCGVSLPMRGFEDASSFRCSDCGDSSYFLDKVRAWGDYEGPLRILHHAFKFEGMEGLRSEIVDRLNKALPTSFWEGVEALVPVPLSPEKERERGYNPSSLVSLDLTRVVGIETKFLINKTRPTPPQMSLPKAKRLQNPQGAYAAAPGVEFPSRIVLVDDVYTTGATLEECAKVLKKAGAQWVGAVVFGRTPHQS